jgi:predicted DsbA family dithiol-disulfide isomerase
MPAGGIDRKTYRSTKFGTWSKSLELDAQVAAVGRSEGIDFQFTKIKRTPNTLAAHRLIWFAQRQGLQDEIVEALFRGYFIEGRDIADAEELALIAASCGIDAVMARNFLDSDEGAMEVAGGAERSREQGISGVPTFIVNETRAISGALESDALGSLLLRESKITALA